MTDIEPLVFTREDLGMICAAMWQQAFDAELALERGKSPGEDEEHWQARRNLLKATKGLWELLHRDFKKLWLTIPVRDKVCVSHHIPPVVEDDDSGQGTSDA